MAVLCVGAVVVVLLCSGLLAQRSPLDGNLTAEEVYDRAKPAVVQILALNKKGEPVATGSGFFIDRNGTVATNYHVAAAHDAVALALVRADERIAVVTGVTAFDQDYDIALLESGLDNTAFVTLASAEPRVGSRVFAVGNPQGLAWSPSDGLVSSLRRGRMARPWVQTTAPISSGSSGGPLLDANGRLVGMTTFTVNADSGEAAQNLNFASPATAIKDLISGRQISGRQKAFPISSLPR
jgi:S1-C subfamily serine protease